MEGEKNRKGEERAEAECWRKYFPASSRPVLPQEKQKSELLLTGPTQLQPGTDYFTCFSCFAFTIFACREGEKVLREGKGREERKRRVA